MPMMRTKRKASFANVVCGFLVINRFRLVSVTQRENQTGDGFRIVSPNLTKEGKLENWRPNRLFLKPYHHSFAQRLGADSFTFIYVDCFDKALHLWIDGYVLKGAQF